MSAPRRLTLSRRAWLRAAFAGTSVLALGLAAAPAAAAPPPVSAFARLPAIEQAEISPDGTRVALLGGSAEERIIYFAPVDGSEVVLVKLGQSRVRSIRWIGDGYLLANVSVLDKGTNYTNGQEWAYELNRNIVIDARGKLVRSLLTDNPWTLYALTKPVLGALAGANPAFMVMGLDARAAKRPRSMETLVGVDEGAGDSALAGDRGRNTVLWKVDVVSGEGRIIARGGPATESWGLDAAGEPRLRWDRGGGDGGKVVFTRGKTSAGWERLDLTDIDLLGYSDPEDAVYLMGRYNDEASLVRMGLADGSTTPIRLDRPTRHLELRWDPYSVRPVVIVTGGERPAYQWLDPELGVIQARLDRRFAGRDVQLSNWSQDRSRIVARVAGPSDPPAWFLFDTVTDQASPLGEAYPELTGAALGATRWITYRARDGLEIPAYLTLPPGSAAGSRPPLIVMPHGRPGGRDAFGFDWWVQALAARGYAVLQPQYRGSGGFGRNFEWAGNRQWGGRMQDDLADGVQALVDQGLADPARAAIAGAGYGGYAALMGATAQAGVFRCAISVNGVSNLALLMDSGAGALGRDAALVDVLAAMMGDPRDNPEAFRKASPVYRVDAGTAPVLLIHAENDTTVPPEQSLAMRRALRRAGKPADLVVLAGDDHYLSTTASRAVMLESMLAFLARHLPVGP